MRSFQKLSASLLMYTVKLIVLQLFLFLLSLPILLIWGLPISIMTIIATPFFTPFLTLFLSVSVIIFFCLLCSIPYTFFLVFLDYLVLCWDFFLQKGSKYWLYGFAIPSQGFMWIIAIVNSCLLLYFLQFSFLKRLKILVLYGTFLIGFFWGYTQFFQSQYLIKYGKKGKHLLLYQEAQKKIIIDQGFFSQCKSAESWIRYTLIPDCIKSSGTSNIDTIVVKKWSTQTVNVLNCVLRFCIVRQLIVPPWDKDDIAKSDQFHRFIDNVAANCVTLITVYEGHTLCVFDDTEISCTYNQKKRYLEAWRSNYDAKKSVIYYRV